MKIIHSQIFAFMALAAATVQAHGPGHFHRSELNRALDLGEVHIGHDHGPGDACKQPEPARTWGGSVTTGWESRHVHYGVDETGPGGAWTTEASAWIGDLSVNVWNGFGLGNPFLEWDFAVAYNVDLGPVFLLPGYNFRYTPGHAETGGHEDHGHEEHDGHEDSHAGHEHGVYGNELFLAAGTRVIPYVTPNVVFLWNMNEQPGGFVELRLDGDLPVWRDTLGLQPYALLGLNLGYNTPDHLGWNNAQFGVQATAQLTRHVSVFAGVGYSVALEALRSIGQENVVWANAGLSVGF